MVRTIKNPKIQIVTARTFDCELSKSFSLVKTPGLFLKEITMGKQVKFAYYYCRECAYLSSIPPRGARCSCYASARYDRVVTYSQRACDKFVVRELRSSKGGN